VSVEALHDALADALTSDATLVAALTAPISAGGCGFAEAPRTVLSNRPMAEVQQMHQSMLPAWVIEPGSDEAQADDGGEYGITIGGQTQRFRHPLLVSLVWKQQDRDTAYRQRLRIPALLIKLCLRRDTFGIPGCEGTAVRATEPDAAATHPFHVLSVQIDSVLHINRS
jgi:hypothetical protein